MLEEEWDSRPLALVAEIAGPLGLHWAGSAAAFPSHDDPVDAVQTYRAEVFEEGLDGEEADSGRGLAQVSDAGEAVLAILHTDSPPDVRFARRKREVVRQEVSEALRALGEDLEGVVAGFDHGAGDADDVLGGDILVEEVAHGVDEDHARPPPPQGLVELLGDEAEVESLLVGMPWNAAEPFGEDLSVAIGAARTHLGASADGVPGGVGPFDVGVQ